MSQAIDIPGSELERLADQICTAVIDGLVQGLERSDVFARLLQVLTGLGQRLDELERSNGALNDRLAELQREVAELKKARPAEPVEVPPLRPAPTPIAPPANTSLANIPFGLSSEPVRRSPLRRNRNPIRPTVIYRTDPRTAAPPKAAAAAPRIVTPPMAPAAAPRIATPSIATPSIATPPPAPVPAADPVPDPPAAAFDAPDASEVQEEARPCSEPGCDRPVHCRGLCTRHYQRVRHKERTIEVKQANDGPFPPPPPPRRPAPKTGQREGGTRGVFALLYEERGRRTLAGLINQMKYDRSDLVERLNQQFAGLPGVPLEEEDVLRAIHYHQLGESLRQREGEIICRHLNKQRGSLAKTAQKLKLELDQFKLRIEELELRDRVAQIRNEFRDQILEHSSFSERLELALTREKYLKDLDIEREVDLSLRSELEEQLKKLDGLTEPAQADEAIRQALCLDEQGYRRLLRRFELEGRLEAIVGAQGDEGGVR